MGAGGGFAEVSDGGGDFAEVKLIIRVGAAFFRATRAVLASCRWRCERCNRTTSFPTEGGDSTADGPGVGVGAGDGAGAGTGSASSLALLRSSNAAQQWEGGVIYHEFTTNRQNHLPPRFIVGMWLAGPVLAIRGMISSINLATLKVVEEERAVMGGCVGSERRVHMSSDSDRKK